MLEDSRYGQAHAWLNEAVGIIRKNRHVSLDDILRIATVHTSVRCPPDR
jgi:hypothetical protein